MKQNQPEIQPGPTVSFSEKMLGPMVINSSGDKKSNQMHNKNTLHAIKRRMAQSK